MTDVGLLSLPIFGIVALGWAATRARVTSAGALDALGAFAFRFALPALVFRLPAGQPLAGSFHPAFYAGYLASGGLLFAVVFGLSRALDGRGAAAAGASATASKFGNLGFLGPPLWVQAGVLLAALPPAGNVYVVAQRYAADADRISAAIVLSTTVGVVTVPVTAWLVVR
jgi:predicted permease